HYKEESRRNHRGKPVPDTYLWVGEGLRIAETLAFERTSGRRLATAGRRVQPLSNGPGGDLRPGGEAQLVQDVLDVSLGGSLRDHELCGDLAVRQAVHDEGRDLPL